MKIALHSVYRERAPAAPSRYDFLRRCAAADRWQRHVLVDTPEKADAILITEAWRHHDRPFFGIVRRCEVARRYPGRVFVYCDSDTSCNLLPGFYPSITRRCFDPTSQVSSPYLTPMMMRFEERSHDPPTHLFTFRGSANCRCRRRLMSLSHHRGIVQDVTGAWATAKPQQRDDMELEYISTLASAKYVLCPRGKGASSYRIFETMALGRVPVILSDAWVEPPGPDWSACSIRVPERDALRIPEILERAESNWGEMAARASRTYRDLFSTTSLFNWLADQMERLMCRKKLSVKKWRGQVAAAVSECAEEARCLARQCLLRRASLAGAANA